MFIKNGLAIYNQLPIPTPIHAREIDIRMRRKSGHPDVVVFLIMSPALAFYRTAGSPSWGARTVVQPKLKPEIEVADALEHGAETERPGDYL